MAIEDVKVQGPCKKLYDKLKARNKMIAEFTNYPIIINNDLEDWIYFPAV